MPPLIFKISFGGKLLSSPRSPSAPLPMLLWGAI
nr:MAG TPA: hypothetical protein [Caudoviricetes sp.]